MPIQVQGNGGVTADVDGSTYRALRVAVRPPDYGALGAYTSGTFSGVMAAGLAANSELFQFRWTSATNLAVINSVTVSASVSTTFFAAGVPMQLDLVKATAWTVAGTGGTRISPAALLKKRSSMGSSLVAASDIGIATTTGLTAGTKTLEAASLAAIAAACPITASLNGTILTPTPIFKGEVASGIGPLVLVANEGFVIRSVAVPATGTWTFSVTVDWSEVAAY